MGPVAAVHGPFAPDGGPDVQDLTVGDRVTFGACGCAGCDFDIVISSASGAQFAGAVTAFADHWRLDNLSISDMLIAQDLEDPHQFVRLRPGRVGVAMPFELARITCAGQPSSTAVTVFGPEPDERGEVYRECPSPPAGQFPALDRDTTYYAVLRALCEPRLRSGLDAPLPTSKEIANALQDRAVGLTRRAVDHHIDYLVERLGLHPECSHPVGRSWKKEALASAAIRRGVVAYEPGVPSRAGQPRGADPGRLSALTG